MPAIREEYQVMVPADASPDVQTSFKELNQILYQLQQLLAKIQGLNDLTPEFVNDVDLGAFQINNLAAGMEGSDGIRLDQAALLGMALTTNALLIALDASSIGSLAEAADGELPIGDTGNPPVLATLTGTVGEIVVTNAAGSITLSLSPLALTTKTIALLASITVHLQNGDPKTDIYTVPAGKSMIVTHVVIRNPTASLAGATDIDFGDGAAADTWVTAVDLSAMTLVTDYMVVDGNGIFRMFFGVTHKYAVFDAGDVFGVIPVTGAALNADATAELFGYLF